MYGFVAYFFGAARAFVASAGGAGHGFNFLPRARDGEGKRYALTTKPSGAGRLDNS